GANTICVDVDDDKLQLARLVGGAHTVNSAREALHKRMLELTDGRGPDVVIEAVGLPNTFRAAVEEVAFTGRVVYIGYAKEHVSYDTRMFVQKELDIMGSRNALAEDFHAVIRMLEERRLPDDEDIRSIVALDQASEALRSCNYHHSKVQKLLCQL